MQKIQSRIPLKKLGSEPAAALRREGKPIKVLLIDSDHREAYLIRRSIAEAGDGVFALEYTDQLSIGLERLARGGIDVLLLDPSVPDGHGLDHLAWSRAQALGVPIVILSVIDDETSEAEALKQGAQEYLVKEGVDGKLLVRSIYRAIARQRPVSEREQKTQRLESSRAYLNNIIRSNPDGIIIVDKRGIVRFVNPAVESLFGCKAEQLLGESLDFLPAIEGGKTELGIVRGDGEKGVAEIRVVEVRYQGEAAYLVSLRDITERKQAEENNKLAREEAEAAKAASEKAAARAKERARLAKEEAKATKIASEEAVARAKEEARLVREEAKAARIASEKAVAGAKEEARLAMEEAETAKAASEEAVARAEEEARLAEEEAEAAKTASEKAMAKAKEKAEAAQKASEDAIAKAEEETRLAREAAEAVRKASEKAVVRAEEAAEAVKKASEEAAVRAREEAEAAKRASEEAVVRAREEAEAAKKASEEAVVRAKEEAEAAKKASEEAVVRAKEEAEAAKKASEEAVAMAKEEVRIAKEEAEASIAVSREATARAEEEARLAREEAEVVKTVSREATARAEKEARLAREETEEVKTASIEAKVRAGEEVRSSKEAAEAARAASEEAIARAEEVRRNLDPMQSEFMSNIIHELRAPLHSILAFTKLIGEGGVSDPETQKEFLNIIADQSEHLRRLVDELVDISPVESGHFDVRKERVAIKDLLQDAVREFYSVANQKNIVLRENIPGTLPEMEVDSQRLRQVMFNLLGNAVKFSNDGGSISVGAEVRNSDLLVQVTDQGVGIAEEAMTSLFEKFYQAKNPVKVGGLGLGLYISKRIIEAHGGRIWADSIEGAGSTFSFTLPLERANRLSYGQEDISYRR
jgi:signal transduction histidine kinase/PAS domain-containing protein